MGLADLIRRRLAALRADREARAIRRRLAEARRAMRAEGWATPPAWRVAIRAGLVDPALVREHNRLTAEIDALRREAAAIEQRAAASPDAGRRGLPKPHYDERNRLRAEANIRYEERAALRRRIASRFGLD